MLKDGNENAVTALDFNTVCIVLAFLFACFIIDESWSRVELLLYHTC